LVFGVGDWGGVDYAGVDVWEKRIEKVLSALIIVGKLRSRLIFKDKRFEI